MVPLFISFPSHPLSPSSSPPPSPSSSPVRTKSRRPQPRFTHGSRRCRTSKFSVNRLFLYCNRLLYPSRTDRGDAEPVRMKRRGRNNTLCAVRYARCVLHTDTCITLLLPLFISSSLLLAPPLPLYHHLPLPFNHYHSTTTIQPLPFNCTIQLKVRAIGGEHRSDC